MYDLVSPIVIDSNSEKVWCPYLSISLMNDKILIRKKGKGTA